MFCDPSQQKEVYLNKHTPGTVHLLIKETVKDAIKDFKRKKPVVVTDRAELLRTRFKAPEVKFNCCLFSHY